MTGQTNSEDITMQVMIGRKTFRLKLMPNDGRPYVEISKEVTEHYPDGTSWTRWQEMKSNDIERHYRLCDIGMAFFKEHTTGASMSLPGLY